MLPQPPTKTFMPQIESEQGGFDMARHKPVNSHYNSKKSNS